MRKPIRMSIPDTFLLLTLVALCLPEVALAHAGAANTSGFLAGVLHPITGIDHVLAMVAVGMWGAQLGGNAMWMLPVAFPLVMALGGVAGILGLPMFAIEPGIALSVIVLGVAITANYRPKVTIAGTIVAIFAIFHGYAHGAELPAQAGALVYSMGFVLATGMIHLAGIGIGLVEKFPKGMYALRTGGAAIAIAGIAIAVRLI